MGAAGCDNVCYVHASYVLDKSGITCRHETSHAIFHMDCSNTCTFLGVDQPREVASKPWVVVADTIRTAGYVARLETFAATD